MSRAPDQLTLTRHRDLEGRGHRLFVRWALLTLVGGLVLLGLLNVFGQKPHTDTASAGGVELEVYSPKRLRSGLFFMSRFTIRAEREVEAATLVLDPGWLEGSPSTRSSPPPSARPTATGRSPSTSGTSRRARSTSSSSIFRSTPPRSGIAHRTSRSTTGKRRCSKSTVR